jgi:outer membrane protein
MKKFKAVSAAVLTLLAMSAGATDLMEVWQAASTHDPDVAISQAARQAGVARREQSSALWRPSVRMEGGVALMNASSDTAGAHFSAPGMAASNGVAFNTSVNNGTSTNLTFSARQPLLNRELSAQSRQLGIAAEAAEWEWQSARQDLILHTAQRYFDVIIALRKVDLLQQQKQAVDKALVEAKDRFALGDTPITDTHEASARAQALQAQLLGTQSELQMAQMVLSDATGLASPSLQMLSANAGVDSADATPLAHWQALALDRNPLLRMQLANAQAAHEEVRKFSAVGAASVDLVAQAGQQRLSGNGDFGTASNSQRQQMIGVQLTIPIFTGGYRSARQEEALRLEDKAMAEVERARQHIGQQTQSAWLGLRTGTARVQALAESLKATQARLDATRLGRKVGDRTTLDLLNAENDASSSELALLQATVDVLLSQLRLHALAGELDETQLVAVNAQLQR